MFGLESDTGGIVPGPGYGQSAVGDDPTQGKGTKAWQEAVRMANIINARNRRN